VGHQQALIHYGVAGKATNIKVVGVIFTEATLGQGMLHDLSHNVKLALQFLGTTGLGAISHEYLANFRTDPPGISAQPVPVHRHISPTQELQTLLADRVFNQLFATLAGVGSRRQEHIPGAVLPRFRKFDALNFADFTEEPVGHLHQNASPIPSFRVTPARPSMAQIYQHLERLGDNLVGLASLDVGDHPYAAAVVLQVGRI
jgi:hypothetical protein